VERSFLGMTSSEGRLPHLYRSRGGLFVVESEDAFVGSDIYRRLGHDLGEDGREDACAKPRLQDLPA
jgi:hypothetical protein